MPTKPIGIEDDGTFSGRVGTALSNHARAAVAAQLVPTGGTAGQVLAKTSNTNNAVSWQTLAAGGVTDHGALTGLTDDDHTQYALADGTRGAFASTTHTHTYDSLTSKPTEFPPAAHTHDDRYYTETETDTLLNGKAAAAAAVPAGGAAGQVLSKASATNYATAWIDPPASVPVAPSPSTKTNTPFTVRYRDGAWEFASLTAAQDAGLDAAQTIMFIGNAGGTAPTWARSGDVWMEA